MDNNFKLQLIAIQALQNKYGFCPAPQQVTLLESDEDGSRILFRVGEHEYHCDDGEITNVEDMMKHSEGIEHFIRMYQAVSKDLDEAKDKIKSLEGELEGIRFVNRKLKDDNRDMKEDNKSLKSERDEYIKLWLTVQKTADELIRKAKGTEAR